MAAVSFSIKRGVSGLKLSDITVDTQAPNANDIELRINLTDANSGAVTRKDAVLACEAFINALESGALFSNKPPL